MRTTLVVAVLLALLVLTGVSARVRADPAVSLGSQVRELTVDTNGNGLFDQLQIILTLQVNVAGMHSVFFEASVSVPNGAFLLAYGTVQRNFSVGSHAVPLILWGPQIYAYRADGPYNLTVAVDGCELGCAPVATLTYTTRAYRYTQFDPPYAFISGPVTDSGRDTNGDGYYDLLVVTVPVTVNQTVELAADVSLSSTEVDAGGPMSGGAARTYAPGTYRMNFTFDGRAFYYYRASGPYTVSGALRLVGISFAGGFVHTTAAYPYAAFQRADANFTGDPTYELVDTNGNGNADVLRIHVPLRVTVAGDYIVQSDLGYGYGTGANVYRAVHLDAGTTTLDLDYNGIALGRLGYDGPWYGSVMIEALNGPVYDGSEVLLTTPAYLESAFESRPVSSLAVNVTIPGCTVNCLTPLLAYDPSNGDVVWSQPDTLTTLPLYNGTFEVLVETTQGSAVRTVTVSGDTSLDVTVAPPPVDRANQTYDFVSVNESVVTAAYTTWGGAPGIRFMADLLGNHDGIANATELGLTEGFFSGWHNRATLALDGESYPLVASALTGVDGAGPVTDPAPVVLRGSLDYRFPELPSPTFPKNITLSLPWIPPYYQARYDFQLPAGTVATFATGNPGVVTRVSSTEWTLTAAAPMQGSFAYGPWTVVLEVGASPSTESGPGSADVPVLVLALVAVPAVAVVLGVLYVLRRPRRGAQGGAPPPQVPPPTRP